jgi:hypothetical protein
MADIPARQTGAHGVDEFAGKQSDQHLQQVVALPAELGDTPAINFDIERNREHLDETPTDAAVAGITSSVSKPLDLWQNFQRATLGCNDANHLSGAQIAPAVSKDTRASFATQRRRSRDCNHPVRSLFRNFALSFSVGDTLPFKDGAPYHRNRS